VGEADARVSVGRVLAVLREAGRAEGTVRRQQVVLDRFAAFLAGRGLDTVSDRVYRIHREPGRGQVGVVAGTGQ
jgi:integrase/recombinase XerD